MREFLNAVLLISLGLLAAGITLVAVGDSRVFIAGLIMLIVGFILATRTLVELWQRRERTLVTVVGRHTQVPLRERLRRWLRLILGV